MLNVCACCSVIVSLKLSGCVVACGVTAGVMVCGGLPFNPASRPVTVPLTSVTSSLTFLIAACAVVAPECAVVSAGRTCSLSTEAMLPALLATVPNWVFAASAADPDQVAWRLLLIVVTDWARVVSDAATFV